MSLQTLRETLRTVRRSFVRIATACARSLFAICVALAIAGCASGLPAAPSGGPTETPGPNDYPMRITVTGKLRGEPFELTRIARCYPPTRADRIDWKSEARGFGWHQNIYAFGAQLTPSAGILVRVPNGCHAKDRVSVDDLTRPPGIQIQPRWEAWWVDDSCYPTVIEDLRGIVLASRTRTGDAPLTDLQLHFERGQPDDAYSKDRINPLIFGVYRGYGRPSVRGATEARWFFRVQVRVLEGWEWQRCSRQREIVERALGDPDIGIKRGNFLSFDRTKIFQKYGIITYEFNTACESAERSKSSDPSVRYGYGPVDLFRTTNFGTAKSSKGPTIHLEDINFGRSIMYYVGTTGGSCRDGVCDFVNSSDYPFYTTNSGENASPNLAGLEGVKLRVGNSIFTMKEFAGVSTILDLESHRMYLFDDQNITQSVGPGEWCRP